jgi:hypothetical protein
VARDLVVDQRSDPGAGCAAVSRHGPVPGFGPDRTARGGSRRLLATVAGSGAFGTALPSVPGRRGATGPAVVATGAGRGDRFEPIATRQPGIGDSGTPDPGFAALPDGIDSPSVPIRRA